MVSVQDSQPCRFTVRYAGNLTVLSRVLDILNRFDLEPAWLFTRVDQKGAFRLDVRLVAVCDQRANVIAARIGNLADVTRVSFELLKDKTPPGSARVPNLNRIAG